MTAGRRERVYLLASVVSAAATAHFLIASFHAFWDVALNAQVSQKRIYLWAVLIAAGAAAVTSGVALALLLRRSRPWVRP